MVVERGQIYWCRLDPVEGHEQGAIRPVVVVSADPYNRTRTAMAAIVPLTKALPKTPVHLRLDPTETGLKEPSTALPDHARFIDRSRLFGDVLGRLEAAAMSRLELRLVRVLGLG